MKLSIVVPVYNVANLVQECLESIFDSIRQYKGSSTYEILIIDDCSSDDSVAKVEECLLSAKDISARLIKLSHNRGLSAVRNVGFDNVRGDYIANVDSDDRVTGDWFSKIMLAAEYSPDCIGFGWREFDEDTCDLDSHGVNGVGLNIHKEGFVPSDKFAIEVLRSRVIGAHMWSKVFRREILSGIRCNEGLRCYEDYAVCFDYLCKIRTVYYYPQCLYYYRIRKSGNVRSCKDNENNQFVLCCLKKLPYMPRSMEAAAFYHLLPHMMSFLFCSLLRRTSGEVECRKYLLRHFWWLIKGKDLGLKNRFVMWLLLMPLMRDLYRKHLTKGR